jgi:hypothetical protein
MKRKRVGWRFTVVGKAFAAVLVVVTIWGLIITSMALGQASGANLACVLLVDDDQNGPDVRTYYTSALDELSATYDVWDVASQGDPSADDLMGYKMVIWFTGYPRSDTFTSANEAAVAAYLDAHGLFFLSSEDYLYDRGLTSFGQTRLTIASYTNDVNQTDPVGVLNSPGSGLGPYNLTPPNGWPGDLYTDNVVRRSG